MKARLAGQAAEICSGTERVADCRLIRPVSVTGTGVPRPQGRQAASRAVA
jgi:hypothetical protein